MEVNVFRNLVVNIFYSEIILDGNLINYEMFYFNIVLVEFYNVKVRKKFRDDCNLTFVF